jgi:hypothetical protein
MQHNGIMKQHFVKVMLHYAIVLHHFHEMLDKVDEFVQCIDVVLHRIVNVKPHNAEMVRHYADRIELTGICRFIGYKSKIK